MLDDRRRATLQQLVQTGPDGSLSLGAQCAGGLVEHGDGCVLQQGPGDGDTLLLPAREFDLMTSTALMVSSSGKKEPENVLKRSVMDVMDLFRREMMVPVSSLS